MFYQMGAQGLLVEPNPDLAELLSKKRNRDTVISAAAFSGETQNTIKLSRTNNKLISSSNKIFMSQFIDKKKGAIEVVDEITVPVLDINPSIREMVQDKDFGMLSIDVEGNDFGVLEHLDLKKNRPWFIILEPSTEIMGPEYEKQMDENMAFNGYEKIARTQVNAIYRDSGLLSKDIAPEKDALALLHSSLNEINNANFSINATFKPNAKFTRIIKAIENEKTKFVSFDVFDTAILRPVLEPHDIFAFLNRVARDELKSINLNFSEIRRQCERNLRLEMDADGLTQDPSLEQIYERIAGDFCLNFKSLEKIKQLELDLEIRLSLKNPLIFSIYESALAAGKEVIFCSDSYFDKKTLVKMLVDAGYKKFHMVFSSCEIGATKKHGTMFPYVLEFLNVEANSILHLGDNIKSDDFNPKKINIRTFHVVAPRDQFLNKKGVHRSLWKAPGTLDFTTRCQLAIFANRFFSGNPAINPEESLFTGNHEKFGYYAVGPFLYWLVKWIRREAQAREIDRLCFLSRDGYLPLKAWEILYGSDDEAPTSLYLYASRRSFLPLNMKYGNFLSAIYSIKTGPNFTVKNFFFSRFNLPLAQHLLRIAGKTNLMPDMLISECEPEMRQLFIENEEIILKGIDRDAKHTEDYLTSVLEGSQKPALFDVGRKGSFQNTISRLVNDKIFGFYVLTEGNISPNMSAKDFLAAFPQVNRCQFNDEPDTIIYESLFSNLGPSVIGLNADMQPIFQEGTIPDENSREIIQNIQDGALLFIRDMKNNFGNLLGDEFQNVRNANFALTKFWKHETDQGILDDISHEDSVSNNYRRSLSDYYVSATSKIAQKRNKAKQPNDPRKHLVIFCPAMTRVKGGIERVVSLLTYRFASSKYRITILTDGREAVKPVPVYSVADGTEIIHVRPNDKRKMLSKLSELDIDALLVLASGPVVNVFVNCANMLGIPIMLSERADPFSSLKSYWGEDQKKRYLEVYGKADLIAVQLDSFRKIFDKKYQNKTLTLHNPIQKLEQGPQKAREKIIISLGRVNFTQKRPDLLVEAFAKIAQIHSDWKLHIYGSGNIDDVQKLQTKIRELNLSNCVYLKQPSNDVQSIYNSASIFVIPSKFEGFPNVLAEAFSTGLPAVGFQECPGVRELIIDGKNGFLVKTATSDDLSRALDKLISDSTMRGNMGERAAEIFSQKYSTEGAFSAWEKSVTVLLSINKKPKITSNSFLDILGIKSDPRYWFLRFLASNFSLDSFQIHKLFYSPHKFFYDSKNRYFRPARFLFSTTKSYEL
jgi:FkbM family methyltransferase